MELTPFSFAVMVLVGRGGAGPHDLLQMARQGEIYWDAATSQYYAEPKRLARLGYLSARKEPGRTRERTHYTLTPKGYHALREWARTPAPFPRMQHEPIIRLLAADLVDDDAAVLAGLEPLRDRIAELARQLDVGEEVAATLPHRERYLLLNHRLARAILRVHLDWLDEVEQELRARGRSGASPAGRSTRSRGRAPRA